MPTFSLRANREMLESLLVVLPLLSSSDIAFLSPPSASIVLLSPVYVFLLLSILFFSLFVFFYCSGTSSSILKLKPLFFSHYLHHFLSKTLSSTISSNSVEALRQYLPSEPSTGPCVQIAPLILCSLFSVRLPGLPLGRI